MPPPRLHPRLLTPVLLACALLPAPAVRAADDPAPPSYRLAVGDTVEMTVSGEPELTTTQRLNGDGEIRIEFVGTVVLAGKTVREAEAYLQNLYISEKYLRHPMVTVHVVTYAPREAFVSGAVGSPGAFAFPPEATEVDIVEVITKCGGFTNAARRNSVRVTRFTSEGKQTFEVRVQDMLLARTNDRFFVRPGDIVFVDHNLL